MRTTQRTIQNEMNGVAVNRLMQTIEAISADASLAPFQFRATNRWILGGHNRSTVQGFYGAGREDASRTRPFVLDNDEPEVLLGKDQGANPVEYVLHALAGCMTTTLVYYAASMGIRIDELESTLEGDLDLRGMLGLPGAARAGYERIRVTFRVQSDATDEELAALARLQERSPVYSTLSQPVAIEARVERATVRKA